MKAPWPEQFEFCVSLSDTYQHVRHVSVCETGDSIVNFNRRWTSKFLTIGSFCFGREMLYVIMAGIMCQAGKCDPPLQLLLVCMPPVSPWFNHVCADDARFRYV